jgi:hypothetical protein
MLYVSQQIRDTFGVILGDELWSEIFEEKEIS